MAVEKRFTARVDVKTGTVKNIGHLVQYDTANVFVLRLVDGNEVVDISEADAVTINYLKADDKVCVDGLGERVKITDGWGGEITVKVHANAMDVPGMVIATVSVFNGKDKITSGKFSYECVEDFTKDAEVAKDSQFPVLQEAIAQVSTIKDTEASVKATQTAVNAALDDLVSPIVEVVEQSDTEYILKVKGVNGEYITPNIRGRDGKNGLSNAGMYISYVADKKQLKIELREETNT